jgi:hypothetical protein
MKGALSLDDVRALMPEEYEALITMLNEEARAGKTDLDLDD